MRKSAPSRARQSETNARSVDRVLHADEVRHALGDFDQRRQLDVDRRAPRDVIDHQRQVAAFAERA